MFREIIQRDQDEVQALLQTIQELCPDTEKGKWILANIGRKCLIILDCTYNLESGVHPTLTRYSIQGKAYDNGQCRSLTQISSICNDSESLN